MISFPCSRIRTGIDLMRRLDWLALGLSGHSNTQSLTTKVIRLGQPVRHLVRQSVSLSQAGAKSRPRQFRMDPWTRKRPIGEALRTLDSGQSFRGPVSKVLLTPACHQDTLVVVPVSQS